MDKGRGGKITWAQVAERVHLLAELEEALLGPDFARAIFLPASNGSALIPAMEL